MGGGVSDNPEADDEGADRKDPAAGGPVLDGEGVGFAGAEDLAANADGHEDNAEDEGDPDHGSTFLP